MRLYRAGVPMILFACLLLSGCGTQEAGAEELALQMRTAYLSATAITADLTITADYGDTVYDYALYLEAGQLGGSLTVVEPEELSGIQVQWTEEGSTLIYDGASLDMGELSPDGLSPTDGIPLILEALCSGEMTAGYQEQLDGEEVLVVELENPNQTEDGASTLRVWADEEDFSLLRAEVAWEGTTVLAVEVENFAMA